MEDPGPKPKPKARSYCSAVNDLHPAADHRNRCFTLSMSDSPYYCSILKTRKHEQQISRTRAGTLPHGASPSGDQPSPGGTDTTHARGAARAARLGWWDANTSTTHHQHTQLEHMHPTQPIDQHTQHIHHAHTRRITSIPGM